MDEQGERGEPHEQAGVALHLSQRRQFGHGGMLVPREKQAAPPDQRTADPLRFSSPKVTCKGANARGKGPHTRVVQSGAKGQEWRRRLEGGPTAAAAWQGSPTQWSHCLKPLPSCILIAPRTSEPGPAGQARGCCRVESLGGRSTVRGFASKLFLDVKERHGVANVEPNLSTLSAHFFCALHLRAHAPSCDDSIWGCGAASLASSVAQTHLLAAAPNLFPAVLVDLKT